MNVFGDVMTIKKSTVLILGFGEEHTYGQIMKSLGAYVIGVKEICQKT